MVSIDYLLADRRGHLFAEASSFDELPSSYKLAMIDRSKISQPNDGRVLSYDRGHCSHHTSESEPGNGCHCHKEGFSVTFPMDCRLLTVVVPAFCYESLEYWLLEGYTWNEAFSELLDPEEVSAKLQRSENE